MKHKVAKIAPLVALAIGVVLMPGTSRFNRSPARGVDHWAFIRPQQRRPVLDDPAWGRNPIDLFVLARLRQQGIEPAPEAERSVLIRRLSLDLTGLPSTPTDVDRFLSDQEPGAYERVVDRLLGSPHFGEKWARHWLDLARYADSDGYEQDWIRKYAYNYRDWVIAAINTDLPLDQFTIYQIAGDLFPKATRDQKIATGFHCQTLVNREPGTDEEEFRCKEVVDRVNTTATVWLGLTVGCAECHAHPHDPISQNEYYQLYAFFNNSDVAETLFHTDEELSATRADLTAWYAKSNQLAASLRAAADRPSPELRDALATHLQDMPSLPRANKLTILAERQTGRRDTYLHLRGDFLRKGDRVKAGALQALHPLKARKQPPDRLDLARWLVDPDNPLTSRVLVNQIWAHLFGRGLVNTIDDFGKHGAKPSHPELLDWLAVEVQKRGWSRKELIRLIVTSATYRQSSHHRPELTESDPENVLLARQNRFRLPAEDIRDSQLAVSGLLQYRIGGRSFRMPMPNDMAAVSFGFDGPKQKWEPDTPEDQHRRSLYILFQRTAPNPLLMTFDAPDSLVSCARRERSNNPLQALTALNHPMFYECSRALGSKLAQLPRSKEEKITAAFKTCLAREPTSEEMSTLLRFCEQQKELLGTDRSETREIAACSSDGEKATPEAAALTLLSRVLLNLEEFLVRE